VNDRLVSLDTTCAAEESPRSRLVDVLEAYLADLETGAAPDQRALLAAHPDLADELRPYLESLRLLHGATQDFRAASLSSNGDSLASAVAAGARQIGDYSIVREIGRGGMGIVYEAHQKSLNRRVALKILPFAAVLDQRQIARFRNEAQAAAQLHHPHIVPVFAVGQEQGVYYYAMQYIDGQSLEAAISQLREAPIDRSHRSTLAGGAMNGSTTTVHLEAAGARISQRSVGEDDFFQTVARLGKEAAEALQHAHDYGIVHRDVKPSNLLLDNQGKLWVTDFGLARMQAEGGVTLTGDVVGTLRYMSPEQAAGRTALVDARTDVYSLGATLYELLTQQHAHAGEDRQTLLRQIVNEEPVPPRRHNAAVPVDLETIVLSAMAKTREERYSSAQAMRDDLERFLAGKPTLAKRPTLADRAGKWARRHRSLVAVTAAALILLFIVSAVSVALLAAEQSRTKAALAEAKRSAQRAQASFERAERHFRQARGAVDHFGMQLADRLLEVPGTESMRRDWLIDALSYYRQFMAEAGDDPTLRRELALAHFKSGVIAAKLGARDDAIAEYEAALSMLENIVTGGAPSHNVRAELAVTHNNLALLVADKGDAAAAREHYRKAIAIQRRLVGTRAGEPAYASQLAESQANLGMLLDQIGESAAAEASLRAAVEMLRPLAESFADEPKYARNLAIACNNLCFVLRKRDADIARPVAQEAVEILQRLTQKHPGQLRFEDDLALCYNNLAAIESHRGGFSEAARWHAEAIAIQERLVRKAPAVVRHRSDLAISLNNLGVVHCRLKKPAETDAAFARAQELFETLADDYPNELAYRSSLAALLNNQALALAEAGRLADAVKIYPAAIESQRLCWLQLPGSPIMREALSKMYYNYGQGLSSVGRFDEAARIALARREIWKDNAERLIGVAAELAQIRKLADGSTDPSALSLDPDTDAVATLRHAGDIGWPAEIDLASDARFTHLQSHAEFAALIADLSEKSSPASASRRKVTTDSPASSN
jgi:serine/threonine protein kinase